MIEITKDNVLEAIEMHLALCAYLEKIAVKLKRLNFTKYALYEAIEYIGMFKDEVIVVQPNDDSYDDEVNKIEFPIFYLTMSEEELETQIDKELEKMEAAAKLMRDSREKSIEETERRTYERLKAKFDKKT